MPTEDDSLKKIDPADSNFTGFVFKIQANMNPRHRDRVAFLRVVSGRFQRGMDARIGRSGATLRLTEPHTFMADERAIVPEAWAGDEEDPVASEAHRLGESGGPQRHPGSVQR